ncbi:MAG: 16S rRNA (cytosine(967)-C(5))-methyltransferase RsmB [Alkalibacterium sp.]|nr:16S rRNA (cytosine(967)-C(5))-methyltransferase RsmB [Alkalibacterium sp.]TVP92497.1 MAG: 16S rRNA (cytosine(967)-C(5))-methyltransferase RsmB [Alkalibacterium sp.]
MKTDNQNSRLFAVQILEKVEKNQSFSNLLLNETVKEQNLSPENIGLLTELVYGVIQNKLKLDYQLEPFIKKQKKIDSWVRQLLRISLYQMTMLDKVPTHAVVDEAVKIAKLRGHRGVSGFVNGVLRKIDRDGVRSAADIKDPVEKMSVQYSYPLWIIELLVDEVGKEETEKIIKSLSTRSKLSLRVNTSLKSMEAVIAQLEDEGFGVSKSLVSKYGLICENGLPVKSDLFKDGIITIQDESSMLVAEAMQIKPSDVILDACAAPGGKTTHMASYLDKDQWGEVVALDLHENKLDKVLENAERLRVDDLIEVRAMDARKSADSFPDQTFDKILVDAPCSGLGLMRRKPDIRYQKSLKDIYSLQKVQLDILNSVAPLLKEEGRMIYSTCTITKKENDEVVRSFLEENKNFIVEPVQLTNDKLKLSDEGYLHLYPHLHGTDGFFIASLRKTSDNK